MTQIRLENITKSFGDVEVLKGITLDISDGELVVFVGPSGCGKSTLLRIVSGLESPTGGDLIIGENSALSKTPKERGIAMVFQNYALYPHKTVFENLAFNLKVDKVPKPEIERRVNETAELLHIEKLLDRYPSALSGGQSQRVAIGRAMVREPSIFLFDEPLSNLDAELRVVMRGNIAQLHESLDSTMIYVTHDQIEAMTLADRIVVLRDGHVQQFGEPLELYNAPTNKFVAGFIGSPSMNFITVENINVEDCEVVVQPKSQQPWRLSNQLCDDIANTHWIGIRPEHLKLADGHSDAKIDGKVSLVERLGSHTGVQLTTEDGSKIFAILEEDVVFRIGDDISVSFPPEKLYFFDKNEQTLLRTGSR